MAKGISKELSRSILELEPTARLEFYIIYYDIDDDNAFIPIHASRNGIDGYIYWQGIKYIPYNVESTQWEVKADQTLPRPKLILSNKNLLVSTLLNKYKNLNNCKVIRKVTYARFLDNKNFPNNRNPYGEENFYAGLPDQKYYVSRVISQDLERVEFELVTPLEIENVKIPNRKIHSQRCAWVYRGMGCQYSGPPVAKQDNTLLIEKNEISTSRNDFLLNGENNFVDASPYQRGDFSTEINTLGSLTGLYSPANDYPIITSQDKVFGESGFYFNGNGGIALSTTDSNDFSHEIGETNRAVALWYKFDAGNTNNQSLIDFGDFGGGFSLYLQSGIGGTDYYTIVGCLNTGSSANPLFVYNSGIEIKPEEWNHAILSYTNYSKNSDIPYMSLYHNSLLISSAQIPSEASRANLASTGVNGIGGLFGTYAHADSEQSPTAFAAGFKGYMDDIRFFRSAIEPEAAVRVFLNTISNTLINEDDLNYRGLYSKENTYNRGDIVYVEGKKFKMNTYGGQGFKGVRFYYLCFKNGTTTDPRNDSVNWQRDSCGKSVKSCRLRFGEDGGSLPFGGFPATHRYPFSSR